VATQFVGSPAAVARQLRVLQEATGADELLVTSVTHAHADRVRSHELLAREWGSTAGLS
jgi:alkanesulfonate monooxygenase SsuD/methylene tetrahydromethanopterin reductase-like flavin-dependent oxidoreductase (luciferase family)